MPAPAEASNQDMRGVRVQCARVRCQARLKGGITPRWGLHQLRSGREVGGNWVKGKCLSSLLCPRPRRRIVLNLRFSKVAIFGYLWKTFKGQSTNICFTFEVQRSMVTPKTFEWNNVDTFADTFTATIEKTKIKNNHLPRSSWPHALQKYFILYI